MKGGHSIDISLGFVGNLKKKKKNIQIENNNIHFKALF